MKRRRRAYWVATICSAIPRFPCQYTIRMTMAQTTEYQTITTLATILHLCGHVLSPAISKVIKTHTHTLIRTQLRFYFGMLWVYVSNDDPNLRHAWLKKHAQACNGMAQKEHTTKWKRTKSKKISYNENKLAKKIKRKKHKIKIRFNVKVLFSGYDSLQLTLFFVRIASSYFTIAIAKPQLQRV